jgi:hypothetical protein
MDFFATETVTLTEERLACLRAVGLLVSQAFGRVAGAEEQQRAAGDVAPINGLLRQLATSAAADAAVTAELEPSARSSTGPTALLGDRPRLGRAGFPT